MLKILWNSSKPNETEADARWRKRVSARVLGGRIADAKKWLGSDNGQLFLIGLVTVGGILVGIIEKSF